MKGIVERDEAEIAKFTPVELKEYEDSLKTYRDLKNSLDTAEEKGRNEGREEGRAEGRAEGREEGRDEEKKATIRRLLASGASVDIISIATGMPEVDVRHIIDEISKE